VLHPLSCSADLFQKFTASGDLATEVGRPVPKRSKKAIATSPVVPTVGAAASPADAPNSGGSVKTLARGHTVYNSAAALEFEKQKLIQNAAQRATDRGKKSNLLTSETTDKVVTRSGNMGIMDVDTQQQKKNKQQVQDAGQSEPKTFPCTFCGKEYIRRSDRTKHCKWVTILGTPIFNGVIEKNSHPSCTDETVCLLFTPPPLSSKANFTSDPTTYIRNCGYSVQ